MTTLPQTTTARLPRPMGSSALAHPSAIQTQTTSAGLSGGDVWRVLRANIWLILAFLIVSGGVGVALNYFLNKYYARYTATGWIQLTDKNPRDILKNEQRYTITDINALAVDQRSQAALLKTESLMTRVLQNDANIRATSWFKQFVLPVKQLDGTTAPEPNIAAAKADLEDRLAIVPLADSRLIQVTFSFRSAKDCKAIIEAMVDEHLRNQLSQRNTRDTSEMQNLNTLKAQLLLRATQLSESMRRAQVDLNKSGYGTAGKLSPKDIELTEMVRNKSIVEGKLADAKGELEGVQAQINAGETPGSAKQRARYDQSVQQLTNEVLNLKLAMKGEGMAGDESPQSRRMKKRLEAAEQSLEDTTREVEAGFTQEALASADGAVKSYTGQLQQLTTAIEETKSGLGELDFRFIKFLQESEENHRVQDNLKTIEDQLHQIDLNKRDNDIAGVNWSTKPETPDTPSFPKLPLTLSISMFVGLLAALGIAFTRELLDTTVRSPRDIQRVGQMTLLGMISHEEDDPQSAGVPLPMVIFSAPTSMMAEQYRQVRSRLQHAASLDTTRSILVTSPEPQDGKSTVACNLAAGLALNGRKILLVDANFRRPELHKIFKLGNENGFSNVLASIDNFESAVRQTAVPNLDVLTTGPKPANPTEILESQLLIDFIEKALEEYDHIIFDSGPMLLVSETVALAPRVDGVVTVVRAAANSRGLLQRMRDQLRQLKAEHLGVVLNGVRSQGGGYYGRNIKTYYEYQNGHTE